VVSIGHVPSNAGPNSASNLCWQAQTARLIDVSKQSCAMEPHYCPRAQVSPHTMNVPLHGACIVGLRVRPSFKLHTPLVPTPLPHLHCQQLPCCFKRWGQRLVPSLGHVNTSSPPA
jgi:hypothetical protein